MRTKLIFLSFLVEIILVSGTAMAEITTDGVVVSGSYGLSTVTSSTYQYFDFGFYHFYAYGITFDLQNENIYYRIENATNVILSRNDVLDSANAQSVWNSGCNCININVNSIPFNVTGFDVKTRSDYNLTVTINDTLGNVTKFVIRKVRFIENPEALERIFINNIQYGPYTYFPMNASNMSTVNVSGNVQASFDFKFRNYTNGTMDIARYNSSPDSATIAGSALGKYIEVMLEPNLTTNMQWAIVRIHYTDQELANKSIQNEANLRFYEYDEDTQSWVVVANSGVDTVNNFVHMNVTHFSTYGIYEGSSSVSTSSSGGGGGSRNTVNRSVSEPSPYGKESEYELKKRIVRSLYDRWVAAYPSRSWGAGVDEAVFDLWFRHMEYQANRV